MKFRNIFTLLLLLLPTKFMVAQSDTTIIEVELDKEFLYWYYQELHSQAPSLLSEWEYKNLSYFGASYDYGKGNFRNHQTPSKISLFNFQTEAIYKLPKTKWTLYGKFLYTNGAADSVEANLSYYVGRYGSPYYIFQRKEGNWKLQNYRFDVSGGNRVNDRLSLGFNFQYDGELAFRVVDTRNNQATLNHKAIVGATYRLPTFGSLTLNFHYDRVKTEAGLVDNYYHSPNDMLRLRYVITGLGSFINNLTYKVAEDNTIGPSIIWKRENSSNSFSLLYNFMTGWEYYKNQYLQPPYYNREILSYNHSSHKVEATSINRVNSKTLYSSAYFSFLSGEGGEWSPTLLGFVRNYKVMQIEGGVSSTLYMPGGLLHRVVVEANYISEIKLDRNYGYQFDYSNLTVALKGQLNHKFGVLNSYLTVGGVLGKNLSYLHNPNAAQNNMYTEWVAEPLMSFLTTDFFGIPAQLKFEIPFKRYYTELNLNCSYIFPVKLNYQTGALFNREDNFLSLGASIRLYF